MKATHSRVFRNHSETLHRCYKLIEDVHLIFCRGKNIFFDNITALST